MSTNPRVEAAMAKPRNNVDPEKLILGKDLDDAANYIGLALGDFAPDVSRALGLVMGALRHAARGPEDRA